MKKSVARRLGSLRQAGLTLIETLVALAIFATVVSGAIVLYGSASTSQSSTQLASDLSGVRAAVKGLYYGQGGYGTASLNTVLVNGKRLPSSWSLGTDASGNQTVNHPLNGTVTVTGATNQFTISLTNIPTAVCLAVMTTQGWDTVKVGSTAARTAPVSPSTASTDCSAASTQTMVFTAS